MDDFKKIYDTYSKSVYRFLLAMTGDVHMAEELLQETFYQAFLHIGKFEGRSSVYTWLCQIGKNAWYKECMRRKRLQYSEETDITGEKHLKSADSPEEEFIRKEAFQNVRKAIFKLKQPYQDVLAMEYVNCIAEGKYEEAAEMMEPAFKIEYLDVKGYVYGMYEVMDLRHGNVSNMTQEEYCQFRKNQFIERMNKWDDHTKITGISFVRADADVNSWDISIEVEQESLTEDETWKSTLIFEVYSKTGYISCEGKKGPEQWWDVFEWMDVMDIYHK